MSDHYWSYCNLCETNMVICGTCGNNCCNGGYGQINGKQCPDCPFAYQLQSEGLEEEDEASQDCY